MSSVLDLGSRCSFNGCNTVDFLPLSCPHCSSPFCTAHIQTHPCSSTSTSSNAIAGPSSFSPRSRCPIRGCGKPTISAIAGVESSSGYPARIGKAVLCPGCQVAYCVSHRQADQHGCPGPRDYTIRNDAHQERKAAVKGLLEKNFPGINQRSKPAASSSHSASKEILAQARAARAGTSKDGTEGDHVGPAIQDESTQAGPDKKVKSKAEKLHELHIRKIRGTAVALDPHATKGETRDKRYLEWVVGGPCDEVLEEKVKYWQSGGRWEGDVFRAWILSETPCGKVLDLMMDKAKCTRPSDPGNPSQAPGLLCLTSLPDQARTILSVDHSWPATKGITEGGLVLLIRGKPDWV